MIIRQLYQQMGLAIGQIQVFVYLQVLDLLTTLVGLKMGASEANPFICVLMHAGPAIGVTISKILALGLAGICIYTGRRRVLRYISYWYGALVVWNLTIILVC